MTGSPGAPILAAKLVVPPARDGAVVRDRLQQRLQDAAASRLCVVVAPAGFGKTTLLSQWATREPMAGRTAWVSLDGADDEPVRFWTYALTALYGAVGLGGPALQALSVPGADPVSVALPLLLNEAATRQRCVLVLDDFHAVGGRGIQESVEFLVTYLPLSLGLVLAGRSDPALPLARLRARGELTEIRADDLRFGAEESAALLRVVSGTALDPASAAGLHERTEGWAAGLQLAGLALRGSARPATVAAGIRGDDRHILDYLSTEVLDRLEAGDRDLLVRTSVLNRLSGPLCDAVLERTGSAEVLHRLDTGNLFVSPLDRRREWYRCHGLFRDVLRRELDPTAVPPLLVRAAEWHAADGRLDEAVRLRIEAGDADGATALLRTHDQWFLDRGAAATFLELGERLAASGAPPDPEVSLMLVYAAVLTGTFDRVAAWCDVTETLMDAGGAARVDGWHSARASLLTMRAAYGHEEDTDPEVILAEARRAADLEHDRDTLGYVVARTVLGSSLARAGRHEDAWPVFADGWSRPARALLPTSVALQFAGLYALTLVQLAELDEARAVCTEVAPIAERTERDWGEAAAASVAWFRLAEGRLLLRSGDAAAAGPALRHALELARAWGRDADQVAALTSLAEAAVAAGDGTRARAALSQARAIVDTEPVRRSVVRALEGVETRLGRGAARAARRVGQLHEELTDRELSILRLLPGPASQREIGEALFLSVNTVKGYAKSLYRKLGVSSRAEAVEQARALGLI